MRLHSQSHKQSVTEDLNVYGYSSDEHSHATKVIPNSNPSIVREDFAAQTSRTSGILRGSM